MTLFKLTAKKTVSFYVLLLAISLALPILFIYFQLGKWNPFMLKGPQFLSYYAIILFAFFSAILFFPNSQKIDVSVTATSDAAGKFDLYRLSKIGASVVLIIGLARVCQGISNQKPVGFLVTLIILHSVVFAALRNRLKS